MSDAILPAIQSTAKLYLSGPFGAGKTELAIQRIRWLLSRERTRGDDSLVLVPQQSIGRPFQRALRGAGAPPGPPVRITTTAGLARSAVELYWPLLATSAGFGDPRKEPTFLNLETAQYHMTNLVDEALARGEFDGIRVDRNRIILQVLDNLNKAAMHGFSIDEAYARLELAVPLGETRTGQINALRAARRITHAFRILCMEQTLIDFSLQIDLFTRQILTNEWSRTHLFRSHRHLIVENTEEQNAVSHDLVRMWLPQLESALSVVDEDGGYRLLMGADPVGAQALADACEARLHVNLPPETPTEILATEARIDRAIRGPARAEMAEPAPDVPHVFQVPDHIFRYYPQMIRWVVEQVRRLVQDTDVPLGQIAIVAPFLSDALRFSLQTGLSDLGIPSTTHRPSRPLQDEPASRCLLTLAALAHPDWGIRPPQPDVVQALLLSIDRLDPVRASLLTHIVYPMRRSTIELTRFGALESGMQSRITFAAGEAYDRLRDWIYAYRTSSELLPLDQFFARLFGEVLSQPGFGFHDDFDAARIANQLVQSSRNFRWALEGASGGNGTLDPALAIRLGRSYFGLITSGAVGALFIPGWQEPQDAVFISPAYTFLMRNRVVDYQFWLDVGSTGWWERLYQPLTHPYVLSRQWPPDQVWSDMDEYQTRQELMRRVLLGLLRRTRRAVYLGISEYGEQGFEQRGALLNLINQMLAQASAEP